MSQHVLIIGKVWIEPGSSAAGSRTLQLIEVFRSAGYQVSFATTAGDSPYKTDLDHLQTDSYQIELNNSSFDSFIKELNPTIVVFDRFTSEEQFGWRVAENCPDALRILDTIDLHCLRAARHTAVKENRVFSLRDLVSDISKREIASIYRCDLSLMISEVEMDLLKNYFKIDPNLIHYTPFLQDPISSEQQSAWPAFESRQHFISIGNFLHEPNWDSVLFIKQEIWPLIRQKMPKAEMHVYGAYPSQKVFELHQAKTGFLIKGRADDAGAVMRTARICLAPLRFGAGIKGKLLDAMLYGTPSITTPIGAESMHGDLPWNGRIEITSAEIAEAAVDLYNDENKWQISCENGVRIINNYFSKKKHTELLLEKIADTRDNLEERRFNNFTGAMLMHHTVAATKYMALWIAAKNVRA